MRAHGRSSRVLRPELWLVVAIPLASLVGGVATLHAVAGDLSSDGTAEGARHTAQVQEADLAPDLAAARLGLAAQVRIERTHGRVEVTLPWGTRGVVPTRLRFVHPLRADADMHLRLRADGAGRWMARQAPAPAGRWRIVVEGDAFVPPGGAAIHWRLVGALPRDGRDVALRPALAAR